MKEYIMHYCGVLVSAQGWFLPAPVVPVIRECGEKDINMFENYYTKTGDLFKVCKI